MTGGVLAVPKRAVIDTGLRKIVFIDRGESGYELLEVELGPEAWAEVDAQRPYEQTAILSGCKRVESRRYGCRQWEFPPRFTDTINRFCGGCIRRCTRRRRSLRNTSASALMPKLSTQENTMVNRIIEICMRNRLLVLVTFVFLDSRGLVGTESYADRCDSRYRRKPGHRVRRLAR